MAQNFLPQPVYEIEMILIPDTMGVAEATAEQTTTAAATCK